MASTEPATSTRDWPEAVYSDSGKRYAFAGVDKRKGMYGGMSGFAFTLAEARRFTTRRHLPTCEANSGYRCICPR